MSGVGREMVTRCFSEWRVGRIVWWISLRGEGVTDSRACFMLREGESG
jgi:hypothetical protein